LTTIASEREGPAFLSTANPTSPGPAPDLSFNATHSGAFSTAHEHPAVVLTLNTDEPPSKGNDADVGLSESTQRVTGGGAAASCVTAIDSPPILREPDRAVEPSFALTPKLLVPDPAKEPVGMPIHGTSVPPTDHLQSADAEIVKATSCAAAVSLTLRGSTEVGQGAGAGAASCETEIVRPPTLTSPEREEPLFALTTNPPLAVPVPERV